jgi:hypothetical protein
MVIASFPFFEKACLQAHRKELSSLVSVAYQETLSPHIGKPRESPEPDKKAQMPSFCDQAAGAIVTM